MDLVATRIGGRIDFPFNESNGRQHILSHTFDFFLLLTEMFDGKNTSEILEAVWVGIVVANFLVNTYRVERAIELCKESLIILSKKDVITETELIQTFFETLYAIIFKGCDVIGDYTNAIQYGRKLLAIHSNRSAENAMERRQRLKTSLRLATIYHRQSNYVEARRLSEEALAISKEIGDKEVEASSHESLGIVFQSLGEHVKAKEYLEKALAIKKEIGDREEEGRYYGNLGNVFASLGEYAKAKEFLEKDLALRIEVGDIKGEASCYVNLGTVLQYLGEYVKAKEYYNKALTIRTKIGQKVLGADYANLGSVSLCLGEYYKAKDYTEKALLITKETGDKSGEATCYGNLGAAYHYLGKIGKAKGFFEKALAINQEIGSRNGEATGYEDLGKVFLSLGNYEYAKEYFEKALAIRKEIGDRKGETLSYGNLGKVYKSLGKYEEANDCHEIALEIALDMADRNGEATCYGDIGNVFLSIGEYAKAEECLEKALLIRKESGDKDAEANDYADLGTVFLSLGKYVEAEDYLEKALAITKETGNVELQLESFSRISWLKCLQGDTKEAMTFLHSSVRNCEELRRFLGDNDEFKILLLDQYGSRYWVLSRLLCNAGKPIEALYVAELGRGSALADLMSAQYSVVKQISAHPKSWDGIEEIVTREGNGCSCLYISYSSEDVILWVLKRRGVVHFREGEINDTNVFRGTVRDLDDFFDKSFRGFGILPKERCEDRSLNSGKPTSGFPGQEESQARPFRLIEEEDENQDHVSSLSLCHKMIISPVADLLEETEIIIVPDRSLYRVPFAALQNKYGKYLSETFRIRIAPSLMILKLIQDSPADYHSQTGALIVGDPDVGLVRYKGKKESISRLPCARKEAERIGRLLGVKPLLGEQATKQAVLERINSVSLIHFAAHGDAERGEIALSPVRPSNRTPKEEEYLLTMSDISRVQLRAKLVVLSCCHSSQGQIRVEGVVGIARAFLGSGARSVLVALWAIQDIATEQFMNCFYDHLVHGESANESLHRAMKWMRANGYSDVREWAPFMLIGDNVTFDFGK